MKIEKDFYELINYLKNDMEELKLSLINYALIYPKADKETLKFISDILNKSYSTCNMVIDGLDKIAYEHTKQMLEEMWKNCVSKDGRNAEVNKNEGKKMG